MTSPLSSRRVRDLLRELRRQTAERAEAEAQAAAGGATRLAELRRAYDAERDRAEAHLRAGRAAAEQEYTQSREQVLARAEQGLKAAKNEYGTAREEALERSHADEEAVRHEFEEFRWTQDALFEARTKKANAQRETTRRRFAEQQQAADAVRREALGQLHAWRLVPPGAGTPAAAEPPLDDPAPLIDEQLATARDQLQRLKGLIAPRLLAGDRYLFGAFVTWVALAAVTWFAWSLVAALIVATVLTPLAAAGLWFGLRARARSQSSHLGQPLFRALAEVERLRAAGERAADELHRQEMVV